MAVVTATALGLRIAGFEQSLFGDELYALDDVRDRTLPEVIDYVRSSTEVTPPFFFVLAWFSVKLGDPTIWIKLPSLLLGTATVPVVYLIGRELRGRAVGILAATFVALNPHAIFYSTEARPYAAAAFFVALSTLAVLRGLRTNETRWWALYALATALALYTHYTALFPLAAQGCWALAARRDQARPVVLANALALLLYAPWLPFVSGKDSLYAYKLLKLSTDTAVDSLLHWLAGIPFIGLTVVPGTAALAVMAAGLGLALLLLLWRRRGPRSGDPVWLAVTMAVAAPVGLLAYSLITGYNLFAPRNMTPATPAAALAFAALALAPGWRRGLVPGLLVAGGLAIGAVALVSDERSSRPPYRDAARFIEARSRPGDAVLELALGSPENPLALALAGHLDPGRQIFKFYLPDQAWRRASTADHVFIVVNHRAAQPLGPPPRWLRLIDHRIYRGFVNVAVFEYATGPRNRAELNRR